jgi:hypothetical protein
MATVTGDWGLYARNVAATLKKAGFTRVCTAILSSVRVAILWIHLEYHGTTGNIHSIKICLRLPCTWPLAVLRCSPMPHHC